MAATPTEELARALRARYPELERIREAAGDQPVYLVGGAVRDLLLGRERGEIDLVAIGDPGGLVARLDPTATEYERFGTAKTRVGEREVDVATARSEVYPRPGALPEVAPAEEIEADLGRRDFTVNAMALPLRGEPRVIDPHGGQADLGAGLLRVLHPASFEDDPTRALRAARYAARLGFGLEGETEALLRRADLGTVSADRRRAELLRLAVEPSAVAGLRLLVEWGLVEPSADGLALAERGEELLAQAPWAGSVERAPALLALALEPAGRETALLGSAPASPSAAVELAGSYRPLELLGARARGAEWLDRYMEEWRAVGLEIDGDDLVAAGVPEGPAVGTGLAAALRRKLDGEVGGREAELEAALAVARGEGAG
jgi:tRNA nucleotidyltransferase (CCA-adding enzyme)